MWLLALLCLMLFCQECTTMCVVCLDWWEIRCRDTTGIAYPVVAALLRLPRWSPLVLCIIMSLTSASVSTMLGPFWFRSAMPGPWSTYCRDWTESLAAVLVPRWPIVSCRGPELWFSRSKTTVRSRGAPAIHRVSVRQCSTATPLKGLAGPLIWFK